MSGALKPTNPKDLIGSDKLPIHLWPETATALGCLGLLDGMLKYGRSNWREAGVRSTIYVDAARRHIAAWFEGEDTDPDSGLPHFAHALACLAIVVDADAAGKLEDDRAYPGGYRRFVDRITPLVAIVKAKHAGKRPKHYTIADVKQTRDNVLYVGTPAPAGGGVLDEAVEPVHTGAGGSLVLSSEIGPVGRMEVSEFAKTDPDPCPTWPI